MWFVPTLTLAHVSKHNFASNTLYDRQETKFHVGVKANEQGELLSEDYFPKTIYPIPKSGSYPHLHIPKISPKKISNACLKYSVSVRGAIGLSLNDAKKF